LGCSGSPTCGFTQLTDRAPGARVVEILDGHFDAIATAVAEGWGELLKFIGYVDAELPRVFVLVEQVLTGVRAPLRAFTRRR
jgi:hypothetical protein